MNYGKRNDEKTKLKKECFVPGNRQEERFRKECFWQKCFHKEEEQFQKEECKEEKTDDDFWHRDSCTARTAGWLLCVPAVGEDTEAEL